MSAVAQIAGFAAAVRLMVRVKTAWQTARASATPDAPWWFADFATRLTVKETCMP
jgi:hypothetical protein